MTGMLTAERLLNLTEFSRVMDCIPNGIALDLTRPDSLSTSYQSVLRGATSGVRLALATRVRTPEEEAAYQKAFQFLYTVGASTIAAIYKDRLHIELFFKSLKQHLKMKTSSSAPRRTRS